MNTGKMPMGKMSGAKARKGTPAQEKAVKQLKKRINPKATHPEFTATQAKEVTPEELRG